jgi:rRNA maturation endonuclease Nob1
MEGASAAQKQPAAAAAAPTKLQHVVIDSGAVIHGGAARLVHSAENFWTVSAVIAEIRDKKARHYLDTLPYEIKLREPSEEAMAFAVGFARKTGDLRSLSRVDLSVIALTYQLEKEVTGAAHINAEPTMQRVQQQQQAKPKAAAVAAAAPAGVSAAVQQSQAVAAPFVAVADSGAASDGACTSGPATDDDNSAHTSAAQAADAAVVHDQQQQSDAHSEHSASEADDDNDVNSDDGADEDYSGADSDAESDTSDHVQFDTTTTASAAIAAVDFSIDASAAIAAVDFSIDDGDFPSLSSANPIEEADDSVDAEPAAVAAAAKQPQKQQQLQQQQPVVKSAWAATAIANKDAPFKPSARQQVTRTANTVPVADAQADSSSSTTDAAVAAEPKQQQQQQRGTNSSRILNATSNTGITSNGFDEDDGVGWVSPENYAEQKALGIGLNGPSQQIVSAAATSSSTGDVTAADDEFKPAKKGKKGRKQSAAKQLRLDNAAKCRAGCVTTDFAMQNVLLQMGLPLLSVNGMTVNRVKQWILRCAACFKTTTDMSKLFCPICGNSTLEKVSCSVDATTGVTRLHLRRNYKTNLRGTKFSLPKPGTAGRFKGDLLLREDQLLTGIWAQKAKRSVKSVGSMFGEHITENVGLTINKAPDLVVGYGRKNPNSQRGRERRGKKVSR